jgi:endoglucanase
MRFTTTHRSRSIWRSVAVVTALTVLTAACSGTAGASTSSATVLPGGPYAGRALYVDPTTATAAVAASTADPNSTSVLMRLAGVPQATWLTGGTPASAAGMIAARVKAAGAAVTQFVVYDIPHRDCTGGESSGGASTATAYQAYVAAVAAAVKGAHAVVVLEPDALADLDCLSAAQQTERLSSLRQATQMLTSAGAQVYLDGGHAGWHSATTMAERLSKAGVGYARGFALNISGFDPVAAELRYGTSISAQVGWKRFVVDTSRNGTNPAVSGWCNPAGAALGPLPGTATGTTAADAFLWIKHPGESDGQCGTSSLPAGEFDVSLALALAHTAGW